MTGELVPGSDIRVSDAERDRVVEQLNQAVGEGRLSLAEFEDRVGGVLAAVTQADLARFTVDLPAAVAAPPPVLELRSRASSLERGGRWIVPQQLAIQARSSKVRLDLTEAAIASPTVDVSLNVRSSAVTFVLPRGASATLDGVELSSSTAKSKVPDSGGLHITMHGHLQTSNLRVRYQRRFLRWRW